MDVAIEPGWASERYELDTRGPRVQVRAGSSEGVFRARTTLAQLAASGHLPRSIVRDAAALPWRGLLIDVARHPLSVDDLLRVIDRMALLKLNVLHLHASDDQGFRLELPSHPELAASGGTRKEGAQTLSLTYSPADVARLVAYASSRFVTVVPEIDLPGHTTAILASHPELSCRGGPFEVPSTWGVFDDVLCVGNPATLPFVEDVLTDVTRLFPSRYVHVGGDEVPPGRWSACPRCQVAMRREGVTNSVGLQGVFTKHVSEHLARLGKVPVAWDEVLEAGAPQNVVVMVWRDRASAERALRRGHDVILVPHDRTYLDARPTERELDLPLSPSGKRPGADRTLSWDSVLAFDPSESLLPRAPGVGRVLGGEAALWSEHVESLAEIDTLLFPRLLPIAEALWSGKRARLDVGARAEALGPWLESRGIFGFVAPPEIPERTLFEERIDVTLPPSAPYGGHVEIALGDGPFAKAQAGPLTLRETTRLRSVRVLASGRKSVVREALFEKATFLPPRTRRGETPGVSYRACPGTYTSALSVASCAHPVVGDLAELAIPPGLPATDYSVSYEGQVVVPERGIYVFSTTSDDGSALWIDGTLVVNNDGFHAPQTRFGDVALMPGRHDVRLVFFQGKGGAKVEARMARRAGDAGAVPFLTTP